MQRDNVLGAEASTEAPQCGTSLSDAAAEDVVGGRVPGVRIKVEKTTTPAPRLDLPLAGACPVQLSGSISVPEE
ncbi:hypothetical protein [Aquabacter sediminis]|uniref:hypothetical protein n=1 Tax=Aquabacter sediminis TaxID=3029197 RepID=UPI00237E1574|nr:hypothetical protein [Aquabacter sp. P-9]MDE1569457.1 hypothetical protein [Aquabacter sp. P-9]